MNLLPFDSAIANLLLMVVYSLLVGALANVMVATGFKVLDMHALRRR